MGLIVDNFAGGGGASTGIEMALGRAVDIAINHDPEAIAMHAANHPNTIHYIEDVWKVDPREVTHGQPVDIAWFSPDCTHFSKAKGGKPKSKKIRGLAWLAVKWAQQVRPAIIIIENVEEFKDWGPLDESGQPIKALRGQIFDLFLAALREQGYAVEHRELVACDYGAPTTRKRFFLIARCDGLPIVWPQKTHSPGRLPYRTAAECIDWSIPCPSIFDRKKPLADATLRRIAKGVVRYVLNNPAPFIISYYGQKREGEFRGTDLVSPIPTQTTENRFALVTPYLTEHANATAQRTFSIEEPLRTQCAEVKGGHFALVAAFMAKHYGGVVGSELQKPLGTITGVDHHSLVGCSLLRQFGASIGQEVDAPIGTIMPGGGGKTALVAAFLSKYYGSNVGHELDAPLQTITSKDRFGLVTVRIEGEDYVIADIGMRMLQPRELYRAQGFPDDYIIDLSVQGKKLSKAAQVRMCGNSVPPPFSSAIVQANATEAMYRRAA